MTVPRGLKPAGRKLWRSVVDEYELEEHELILLEQACRTADLCVVLLAACADGTVVTQTAAGPKIRPEIVELRQQRIVLARLFAALRVPLGDQGEDLGDDGAKHGPARLQRRAGARGVYGIRGSVPS